MKLWACTLRSHCLNTNSNIENMNDKLNVPKMTFDLNKSDSVKIIFGYRVATNLE